MIRSFSYSPQQGISHFYGRILSFSLFCFLIPFGVLSGQENRSYAPRPQMANRANPQNASRQASPYQTAQRAASPRMGQNNNQRNNQRNYSPNNPDAQNKRTSPRSSRSQAARAVKERPSENPVRFVFAPKKTPQAADWNPNPSAASIMSTFVTGEMAPEVLQWHVNQRKQVNYEKWLAWKEANSEKPLTHQEANFLHAARQSRSPSSDSEYSRMIARTEFSLGSHQRVSDADLTPPPSNSILLQLFTGYKNQEMKNWKENKIEYLAQNQNRFDRNAAPYFSEEYPGYLAASPLEMQMASNQRTPFPAERAASAAPNRMNSLESPVRTETTLAQTDRFVDDQFPQVRDAAPRRQSAASPIRQVSAEMKNADVPNPSRKPKKVLGAQDEVQKPGELKAYPVKKRIADNALRPLPSRNETAEEEGWNPVP